jgi:hypothetical protein
LASSCSTTCNGRVTKLMLLICNRVN